MAMHLNWNEIDSINKVIERTQDGFEKWMRVGLIQFWLNKLYEQIPQKIRFHNTHNIVQRK